VIVLRRQAQPGGQHAPPGVPADHDHLGPGIAQAPGAPQHRIAALVRPVRSGVDDQGAARVAHRHGPVQPAVGGAQPVEGVQGRGGESALLQVLAHGGERCDHRGRHHHRVLVESRRRPRVRQQHRGVEDMGSGGHGRLLTGSSTGGGPADPPSTVRRVRPRPGPSHTPGDAGCGRCSALASLEGMPAPVIPWGPNRALLLRELGAPTVARGERYAETGMVVQLSFDVSGLLIEAIVRGSGSKTYQTTVYLDIKRGRHAMFEMSSCSCPVGVNCKHGVAALRTAIDKRERGELSESTGTSWQAVLALALPDEPVVEKLPLAVQLSTGGGEDTGVRYLHARIVRPGVRGWVNDGLTWSAIGTTSTPIIDDHRDLLAEIYALYESGARRARYGHGPGSVKDIDLTTVHSPRLWHLLARADQAGVELVHTSRRLGRLEAPAPARLSTAIERTDAGLSIVPQLVLDGVQVDPADLGYLGSPVHGVFAVDGKTWRIRLGELDRPFPRSMLPLLQHVDPVVVPEGDE